MSGRRCGRCGGRTARQSAQQPANPRKMAGSRTWSQLKCVPSFPIMLRRHSGRTLLNTATIQTHDPPRRSRLRNFFNEALGKAHVYETLPRMSDSSGRLELPPHVATKKFRCSSDSTAGCPTCVNCRCGGGRGRTVRCRPTLSRMGGATTKTTTTTTTTTHMDVMGLERVLPVGLRTAETARTDCQHFEKPRQPAT